MKSVAALWLVVTLAVSGCTSDGSASGKRGMTDMETGAAIGAAGGPVGMAAGAAIGAVAGGAAGKGTGKVVNPKPDDKTPT